MLQEYGQLSAAAREQHSAAAAAVVQSPYWQQPLTTGKAGKALPLLLDERGSDPGSPSDKIKAG
jgi:hypothetical protein